MAKQLLIAISLLLVLGESALAEGFYFEARGGANLLSDADNSDNFGNTVESEFDLGWAVEGAVGYAFQDSAIRLEGTLGYRTNSIDDLVIRSGPLSGLSLASIGLSSDGDVDTFTGMVNVYYDFDLGGRITPFVGAGVGFANVSVDMALSVPGALVTLVDDSDTVLAYQGIAGVAFYFAKNIAVTVSYRYHVTQDPSFSDVLGFEFESEYSSHNILAGIRFGF